MKTDRKVLAGLGVGIVALVFGGNGGTAAAASLPPCPAADEAVELQVPAYARAGQGLPMTLGARRQSRVSDLAVTVGYAAGARAVVIPVTLTTDSTRLVQRTGRPEPALGIAADWIQDAGTLTECRGHVEYTLRVIPADASAGNALLPRFFGRFAVQERGIHPHRKRVLHATWKLSPGCDYFACASSVRSSLGLSGIFRLLENGEYKLEKRFPSGGTCTIERQSISGETISKKTIKHAVTPIETIRLKISKLPGTNRVKAFSGTVRFRYPATAYAARKGCHDGRGELERVSGRLLRD